MAHCRGAEARYRKAICEAVSDELHLEGVAELVMHQSLRVKESDQHCIDF
jgi:hypothetical protein